MSARSSGALLIVAALGLVAGLAAQQPRDGQVGMPAGSASISGTVTDDAQTPHPLRRAIVTLMSVELGLGRSAITDDDGHFFISNLPASHVMVSVNKRGYVEGAYGANKPGRPGIPVELRDNQTLNISVALVRAAVLTGRIRDQRGNVVPGLRVFALAARNPTPPIASRSSNISDFGSVTDDRGIYRIFDLIPGDYLITATRQDLNITGEIGRLSVAETDAVLARLQQRRSGGSAPAASVAAPGIQMPTVLAPVYFPGTNRQSLATRVKVGAGEVRGDLDFVVTPVPVTTIEGTIVAIGPLPASVEMSIVPIDSPAFFALGGGNPKLEKAPGTDGRFKYGSVTPGHYAIYVRANITRPPTGGRGELSGQMAALGSRLGDAETMYAVDEVDVTGQPVSGIALRLAHGPKIVGRVIVAPDSRPIPDLTVTRVVLRPRTTTAVSIRENTVIGTYLSMTPPVPVKADGTFEILGLAPGLYDLQLTVPATAGQSWWLRSAIVGTRDLLDTGVALKVGEDLTGVTLTVTDQHAAITGTLQTTTGQPSLGYYVIVMPTDRAMWRADSRRLKLTRPATDGKFSVADLPAGDYLLVALNDVDPDDWQTADFLAAIAPAGVKVTLAEGEKKIQDLRISGR